jgi:N-methylhydantoinase A
LIEEFEPALLQQQFQNLIQEGSSALLDEGVSEQEISYEKSLDLRYLGQSYTLNLKWPETSKQAIEDIVQYFHVAHEHRYGHQLSESVELVNVRVSVSGKPPSIVLPTRDTGQDASPVLRVQLSGFKTRVPVYTRESLPAGQSITGPALITENVATNFVGSGWKCRVDAVGNLQLQYEAHTVI